MPATGVPLNSVPEFWASNVAVAANDIADGVITGAKLTGAARTKALTSSIPTVTTTGTTAICLVCPFAGTVAGIRVGFKDALAANNTNYVTFAIKNKGQAGAGTTDLLAATDANTTKLTGGTAIAAYTTRQLTNHGTASNLDVLQGDLLEVQIVATGTLANTLTQGTITLNLTVTS